ncbi:FGGY family carbohydrate kinase [Geodermatophilus sp. DSM 44513]|uniref:FGGY-family carbohydrate kinase n=1 Tax=Geodermatophilus sp. DSM 44513 TaxID=1528104 RepID=UPI0012853ABC|nr:FGGY family carbohydrate kinase [Geodermatophilus sp. DSM 44513]WNV73868.1 FGGY family carbohydrate kinase [Geodermatophilus sp. DSM 44513]
MTTFLGIDVGTTRTKAVLLEPDGGTVLAAATAPTPQGEDGGTAVHSPTAIREVAVGVARRALADAGPGPRAGVGGIAVTSVGEEAVMLDAAGRPVGDVPTWFSGVGHAPAREHASELDRRAPVTGLRHPEYTVHVLAWWARSRPVAARAAATLTDLGSWLLSSLGPGDLVMDHSHASRTGLFDAPTRSWRPEALDVVGMGHLALPRLVPSGTVVGELGNAPAAALGVAPGIPLVTGGHDHFCGALAAGARSPGDLFVSAGTSEAHLLVTDSLDPAATAGSEVGCFVTDGLYYLHAALPSGSLYLTWTGLLGLDPSAALDDLIGGEPVGSRGVRGRISPDRRLTLDGVPLDVTPATLLRALMETTAVASREVTRDLSRAAGRAVAQRLLAGRPAESATWREIRAAIGEGAAAFVDAQESTALGAAHLAVRAVTGRLPPPALRRPGPELSPERRQEYVRALG